MNTGLKIGKKPNCGLNLLKNDFLPDWEKIDDFEWIKAMKNCMQDKMHHAEGDVYTHTKMVVEELFKNDKFIQISDKNKTILSLAALFHDIAKPKCTIVENGRISSPKHAKVGEKMTRQLLWEMDFNTREQICSLVRLHGLPVWSLEKPNPNASVISSSLRVSNHLLYVLSKSDMLGRICSDKKELLNRVEFFKMLCEENECFEKSKQFANNHSRFKFFRNNETYPASLFDDTEFEAILLSGLPGSGKDTYCSNYDYPVVSLDDFRQKFKVRRGDKKAEGRVIQMAYEQAKDYCRKKQSFIWNSTNLTQDIRNKLISAISPYKPKVKIVYIETSWKNLMERRCNTIKSKEMMKMVRLLEIPQLSEGHEVMWLRNG